MYSIICGSAPFLPMFALISRNAGFNYCLTIFDASLPIRMVLRREILYLTHLIGKYRARLGIFCSDLMEQKREEGKGRRARQIYSKPLLIIDRRHIWSLFASKLDGWKRTPLVTYSFLTRFYLFYISKWIKNLKDLRYINFYHKVLSNKSNTLCNNFKRKIYNSVICYRYINTITESLCFAYIYSNHLVINHLGLELARILSIKSWKSSKKLIFFPRTSRTYSNQLHSLSQKALSTLGSPPYLPKRARANFFFPIDPPQRVIITSILISTVLSLTSQLFIAQFALDSNLGQKLSIKKFEGTLIASASLPPFDTLLAWIEGARIVGLWHSAMAFTVFRPQRPPVGRTHYETSRSIVPAARIYHNPLYNTFHCDNPQLLPPGFKSAVSISPRCLPIYLPTYLRSSRGAR